jgi:hypothetical protein
LLRSVIGLRAAPIAEHGAIFHFAPQFLQYTFIPPVKFVTRFLINNCQINLIMRVLGGYFILLN